MIRQKRRPIVPDSHLAYVRPRLDTIGGLLRAIRRLPKDFPIILAIDDQRVSVPADMLDDLIDETSPSLRCRAPYDLVHESGTWMLVRRDLRKLRRSA